MFLKRSSPKLPCSPSRSTLDPSALNSGIMGGGGPLDLGLEIGGFSFSFDVESLLGRMLSVASWELRKRRKKPEARLFCFSVVMLALLRLVGRLSGFLRACTPASPAAVSPLAKAESSRLRLNKRRMLPCPVLIEVGDPGRGTSSADRLLPFALVAAGEVWVPLVALEDLAASPAAGCGVSGCSSSMGDGRGGGISVPSVREPNLRSRAGNWNLPLIKDGMLAVMSRARETRGLTAGHGSSV